MDTHRLNWNQTLSEQWEWHWENQVRSRLKGLTDEEYFWAPVADAWNVRPRSSPLGPSQFGAGSHTADFAIPEPEPAPFTTIAWRLGHVIVGVLAMRNAAHFGAEPAGYETWEYAGDAKTALAQLETQLERWVTGLKGLSEADLAVPVGPKEPGYPDRPMADLVLHINRELIHHLSEVCLLRDLYQHTRREDGARR